MNLDIAERAQISHSQHSILCFDVDKSTGHRTTHIETHSPLFSAERRVRGKRQVFTSIAICLPSLDGFPMMEIGSGSLVPFSVEVLF